MITNAENQRNVRDRKHEQDLYEVRGAWAPKWLHEKVREYTKRLIKNGTKETRPFKLR